MRKILIVDSEHEVCTLATIGFERWPGTQVVCAADSEQGKQLLAKTNFDLALIGGNLPGRSSFTLIEMAANQTIPALLLADHQISPVSFETFNFPALSKPFSVAEMLSAAELVIRERRENIRRVRQSAARLRASQEALDLKVEALRRPRKP